jgi:hypothetical protein
LIALIMFCEVYKLWSSSLCSLLQTPAPSSLLGPNFLLCTLFLDTHNLCSSLSVRDQVSHPYKTTGKIMFFIYFNLYVFTEQTTVRRVFNETRLELNCLGLLEEHDKITASADDLQ